MGPVGFFPHTRPGTATALGGIATGATVIQNITAIAGYQSLANRTKEEKERIEEDLELIAKLQILNTPDAQTRCRELEKELKLSVERLVLLTESNCDDR